MQSAYEDFILNIYISNDFNSLNLYTNICAFYSLSRRNMLVAFLSKDRNSVQMKSLFIVLVATLRGAF